MKDCGERLLSDRGSTSFWNRIWLIWVGGEFDILSWGPKYLAAPPPPTDHKIDLFQINQQVDNFAVGSIQGTVLELKPSTFGKMATFITISTFYRCPRNSSLSLLCYLTEVKAKRPVTTQIATRGRQSSMRIAARRSVIICWQGVIE